MVKSCCFFMTIFGFWSFASSSCFKVWGGISESSILPPELGQLLDVKSCPPGSGFQGSTWGSKPKFLSITPKQKQRLLQTHFCFESWPLACKLCMSKPRKCSTKHSGIVMGLCLVDGLEHVLFGHILGIVHRTDSCFLGGVAQPPTRMLFDVWIASCLLIICRFCWSVLWPKLRFVSWTDQFIQIVGIYQGSRKVRLVGGLEPVWFFRWE